MTMKKISKESLTILTILLSTFNLINSCIAETSNNTAREKDTQTIQMNQAITNENFEVFYKRFYSDSLFQISRIIFPLKGFNSDEYDSELGKKNPPYFWKRKEWTFLETLPQNYVRYEKKDWVEEYKKEIKHNKDLSVLEKIFIVDSGYKEERIFKLVNGKWYLVFYSYKNF